ncbi:DNA-3-methyladenine glycosylase 2 family protein [Terasakiispira papahanaumokuakeensis]|nr:Ada metal-binding domain-containing protein [Terasakiispira papahanaumokuakeensis]
MLDPTNCYQALISRDARFDGCFYTGVITTGIYCRPVCPARKPKAEHCRFFAHPATAEAAGFRPCLKCRPELAPGHPQRPQKGTLAYRAEYYIRTGLITSEQPVSSTGSHRSGPAYCQEDLAKALGVTSRHLRRTFRQHFGVSPHAYTQTQRLLNAKRLLAERSLSITEIAMIAGFGSLRRMNALFKQHYQLTPRQLRSSAAHQVSQNLHFEQTYRPPYDHTALLSFLGARAIPGVEIVHQHQYCRSVSLFHHNQYHQGCLAVDWLPEPHSKVQITLSASLAPVTPQILEALSHLLDLDANPAEINTTLGLLANHNPGLRAPGAFSGFELAVRAILGQQVSVAAARTLAGRIASLGTHCTFHEDQSITFDHQKTTSDQALTYYFPNADQLDECGAQTLIQLGVMPSRAHAIIALAQASKEGLTLHPGSDYDTTTSWLNSLPGIGPWTAQYIAMRALHRPDVWPDNDHGLKKATGLSGAKLKAFMNQYAPWQAYATQHLWSQR